jgi:hypothetical protein
MSTKTNSKHTKIDVGYSSIPVAAVPILRADFEAFLAEFNRQGGNIDDLEEKWNKHLESNKQADESAKCCGRHKMPFIGYRATKGDAPKQDLEAILALSERLQVAEIPSVLERTTAARRLDEAKAVLNANRKYAELPFCGSINEVKINKFKFDKDKPLPTPDTKENT